MTDVFYFDVSPGTSGDVKHRVRRAQFGDGYGQAVKDGLNTRGSTWRVELTNLREDDAEEVTDWLDAHAGQSFYWTPPRSIKQGRFMCSEYSPQPVLGGLQSISATFEEVFFP
jgi:phage-related protein